MTATKTKKPWLRLYSEILNDRKLKRICLKTGQPKAIVIGVWVIILALASESPERGRLLISDDMPLTIDEIIEETGLGEIAAVVIEALIEAKMIIVEEEELAVSKWDERQFDSDSSTERVRAYRARQNGNGAPAEPEPEPKPMPAPAPSSPPPGDEDIEGKGKKVKDEHYAKRYGNDDVTSKKRFRNAIDSHSDNELLLRESPPLPPPKSPDDAKIGRVVSHFKDFGHGFSGKTLEAIKFDVARYSVEAVILAYEAAIKADATNVPSYANKILTSPPGESNGHTSRKSKTVRKARGAKPPPGRIAADRPSGISLG